MEYSDFVKTHIIDDYDVLLNIIKGKSKWGDLRENYVFRGMKKSYYKLIPSSLRKDKYGNFEINKFISDNEFKFRLNLTAEEVKKIDKIWAEFENLEDNTIVSIITNKNEDIDNGYYPDFITSFNELQFKREAYVLLKFLNHADKLGLKINANQNIRRWIHNAVHYSIERYEVWPKPEFYEIISIAQHNNLPTRALDWSYDYKVALYFAVRNILEGDEEDCVLWAFNYKLFENHYYADNYDSTLFKSHKHLDKCIELDVEFKNYIPPFEIYRPEYNLNDNIKSQKGLFTFLNSIDFNKLISNKPFDEEIVDLFKESHDEFWGYKLNGFENFDINDNEKIFHKFIISGNLKKEILKDLQAENYSKETLFPQFDKIVETMEEEVKFEELLDNHYSKSNILFPVPLSICEQIINKRKTSIILNEYNNEIIDKVYLYSDNAIYGYFYVNEIIEYSVEKLWEKYGFLLNISKHNFLNRIDNYETRFKMDINGLNVFKYSIPLNNFNAEKEYYFIEGNEELEFLLNFD